VGAPACQPFAPTLTDAISATINKPSTGPGVAEIEFDHQLTGRRPAESFLVRMADKCGPGHHTSCARCRSAATWGRSPNFSGSAGTASATPRAIRSTSRRRKQ